MDAGEDPPSAARRECREETGLEIQITGLVDVITGREHPVGADIVLVYSGEVSGGILAPGDDAIQADFFDRNELPELAFNSTIKAINKCQVGV